jgi:hypothetical protein
MYIHIRPGKILSIQVPIMIMITLNLCYTQLELLGNILLKMLKRTLLDIKMAICQQIKILSPSIQIHTNLIHQPRISQFMIVVINSILLLLQMD